MIFYPSKTIVQQLAALLENTKAQAFNWAFVSKKKGGEWRTLMKHFYCRKYTYNVNLECTVT